MFGGVRRERCASGSTHSPPSSTSLTSLLNLQPLRSSSAPCAICREPFGVDAQVILSCTHVFHRACLASFERFVGAEKRSCPICRKASYERRGCEFFLLVGFAGARI